MKNPYVISETAPIDPFKRRTLTGLTALVGLGVAEATGITNFVGSVKATDLSQSLISQYMNRGSVDAILAEAYASGRVKQVEFNGNNSNFRDLVYNSDKPSLVLFHASTYENRGPSNRNSIIFKELAKQYADRVNFNVYDMADDPNFLKSRFGSEVKGENINLSPSIAMYSKFDLVKEESPEKNEGRIKQIDIFREGPTEDWRITEEWLPFNVEWVETNLTDINNKWCWRLNNSSSEEKVFYK